MSRLSRANLKARDSIFAGGPDTYRGDIHALCPPNLEECVRAMENCCDEAYSAQQFLRAATQDLPRITKILDSQRVFLLTNEGTVKRYKSELIDEVETAIHELIERAEAGVDALSRKETALRIKVENARSKIDRPLAAGTQKLETRRLQMLTKQREKLENEVKALEAEVESLELEILQC